MAEPYPHGYTSAMGPAQRHPHHHSVVRTAEHVAVGASFFLLLCAIVWVTFAIGIALLLISAYLLWCVGFLPYYMIQTSRHLPIKDSAVPSFMRVLNAASEVLPDSKQVRKAKAMTGIRSR